MARINVKEPSEPIFTHEGAKADKITPLRELYRSTMSCMLWEDTFYESGKTIADRIAELVPKVTGPQARWVAFQARVDMKLRHVPLLIAREMARGPKEQRTWVEDTLSYIIQRPDELAEFLAIYWKSKKQPLSAQVKKGLAKAFTKFDEYQLAKYNREGKVTLKDVLFMCHAKPKDAEQAALWQRLIAGTLATPDTWEVALSSGANKKETWERLLLEKKLGALALLRNLRNMAQVNVDQNFIIAGLAEMNVSRVLPFRFLSASKYATPNLEPYIEGAMFRAAESLPKLRGSTAVLVDHSASMEDRISAKSEVTRFETAACLAAIVREISVNARVFGFSNDCYEVAPRRGFALVDAMKKRQHPSSTYLGDAVHTVLDTVKDLDRLIIITDEQSADRPRRWAPNSYIINVASNKNGIGYREAVHIDGWSENVLNFINVYENQVNDLLNRELEDVE